MLEDNHLTLQLVRLKRADAWINQSQGFCFVLAKGGSGRYMAGSSLQKNLLPGDVLVLDASEGGKIAVVKDELVFWNFSVCFEHLFSLFAAGEISLLQNTAENLKAPKLYAAATPLAQECHRLVETAPPQGNVDHRSQMLRIAAAVLSVELKNARNQRSGFVRMEDHMMKVFEELSTAELLTLSVGEMAHKFSCSRRHLNRLFHQHFGCSVASLRMEMRLMKALSLLRDPHVKIINVAEQCGFNHLGLFNACFKKRFGNTPGQWRKEGADGPNRNDIVYAMKAKPPEAMIKSEPMAKAKSPGNPKLRETILRNINRESAPIAFQTAGGGKLQPRL